MIFMRQRLAIVLITITLVTLEIDGTYYRRVCYFAIWARWRDGVGRHTLADVDPFLCTHIIFAFAKFESTGQILPLKSGRDELDYQELAELKRQNRKLKFLLAFGGWDFGSQTFSIMVSRSSARQQFVNNSVLFLHKHGFDGMDIDWEYPAIRGGRRSDKENLAMLCMELTAAFSTDAAMRGSERLLLTAAVPANRKQALIGYDIPTLSKYLDFINLMTYNFHGGSDGRTGFNSPLYPSAKSANPNINMDAAARWWHEAGMPKNKITIGLATYGRSFSLDNPREHGVGSPAMIGLPGPVTLGNGVWSYYEVCQEIERGGGSVVFDHIQKVPYYVNDSLWISYDNEQSFQIKAEWVKFKNYGGVMFWALDLDDFNQICTTSTRKYPLIQAVNDVLGEGVPQYETFTCNGRRQGKYADETDCSKFYICANLGKFRMNCPASFVWDPVAVRCSHPAYVNLSFCRNHHE